VIRIELTKLLEQRKRTLYWLSQETGIRWATLAAMAKRRLRRLDLESLDLICAALKCKPGDLLVRIERGKTTKRGK
jgi:putative transcriptional regulator